MSERGHAVVIGASLAGIFAAAALESAGWRVTMLERDRLPGEPVPRTGVPQSGQAHILLHRGLLGAEALLPGLRRDLLDHGAVRFQGGQMPWLGEFGWLRTDLPGYELISATRPLLEQLALRRLLTRPDVELVEQARVNRLEPAAEGWLVGAEDDSELASDLVVDASGRGSRLPHWLSDMGIRTPTPVEVDAHLGYACRVYRPRRPIPLETGVVVLGTPEQGTAGLALPVEGGRWLVMAGGYGDKRPGRDPDRFVEFLAALRDPVLARLTDLMEPVGDVAIHRQTGNRRQQFHAMADWPPRLLAVGDAVCAFNPIYGQGITVAACEAQLLSSALEAGQPIDRHLQRRLAKAADLAWSVATSQDLRQPTTAGSQSVPQALLSRWSQRLTQLSAGGDATATETFARIYNLMGSPALLFQPILVAHVLRSLVVGPGGPLPRPAVLDAVMSAPPDLRSSSPATAEPS